MKKLFVLVLFVMGMSVTFTSCDDAKKTAKDAVETTKDAAKATGDAVKDAAEATGDAVKDVADKAVDAVTGDAEQIKKGKKLALMNGCLACHQEHTKSVGPSYEEVAKGYKEKGGNMTKFLKGNADAIIDPAQFAVMKVNLSITQKMSGDDLAALTTYIRSFE
ncbi:MAG TPA: c-type cytochrome [Lutibacter sp.]|nr:c-type cytochrome [Lutibacter sp.]